MKKYIQLQDSYDSKKGDMWEWNDSKSHYQCFRTMRMSPMTMIEGQPDWFAPYEEKKEYARSWKDLKFVEGYYVESDSTIEDTISCRTEFVHRNIYATENQAKSALAEAQLSQLLMEIYNGENWYPDWDNAQQVKHCITYAKGLIIEDMYTRTYLVALPTPELAEQFLENHRELVETYFLKYKY